jgi:hypothetical protein
LKPPTRKSSRSILKNIQEALGIRLGHGIMGHFDPQELPVPTEMPSPTEGGGFRDAIISTFLGETFENGDGSKVKSYSIPF